MGSFIVMNYVCMRAERLCRFLPPNVLGPVINGFKMSTCIYIKIQAQDHLTKVQFLNNIYMYIYRF